MKKLLGPHLGGSWANNLEILRKWQPPLVLVLQPEVEKVKQLRDACPGAIVIGRFFHDDSHYASNISARPIDFAREIHQEIVSNPVTPLLDYVQSNNETNQNWDGISKLNEYSFEWMNLADISEAYKCAILSFSVGNPDLPDKPGDPAGFDGRMLYWQQVLPSLNYAQHHNHILLLHAYGFPDMFHPGADWYIYRYERQVQANLRTLGITNLKYAYGEIGIDRLIVGAKGGYKVVTNDQDYVNQNLQWERDLQGEDLLLGGAIFTFGDSGGWDTYDIASTNVASMIAEHYVAHAGNYKATGAKQVTETHIPTVSTGTSPVEPALPPRNIDQRALDRGVTVETPPVALGKEFWRVKHLLWFNEQEADRLGPDHHIMADAHADNDRAVGIQLLVKWPTGEHRITVEAKPGEPYGANYPLPASRNEFSISVIDANPSEVVKGIGMGADTPGGFNAGIHTSTAVVFELVKMPTTQPTPTQPQPAPMTRFVVVPAGARLRSRAPDGDTLTIIPYGKTVTELGSEVLGDEIWAHVQGGGKTGWMRSDLLSVNEPPEQSPTPTQPAPLPTQPQPVPSGDNWQKSYAFLKKWEGGYQAIHNDKGNWTGRQVGVGELKGTKFGVSAASYPHLDIKNLTQEQAEQIFLRDYWQASGASMLDYPLCLVVVDTAVLHGAQTAKVWLREVGPNAYIFVARRLRSYLKADNWEFWDEAWIGRVIDLLEYVGKG